MDLVEEPLSGAFLPDRLEPADDLLLCCGLRAKRIGFIDVQIYVLGVYGDPEAIFGQDASFSSADEPVKCLLNSQANKVFSLTLLRSVTGAQIGQGLGETLVKIAGVPKEQVDQMAPLFPEALSKGAELRITVRPSSGELVIGDDEATKLNVPEVIRGLHELYFGPHLVIKGLQDSLQRQKPWLRRQPDISLETSFGGLSSLGLALESPLAKIPSGSELTEPVGQTDSSSAAGSLSPSKSWRDTAGRNSGADGYKFGDFTRTLVQKGRNKPGSDGVAGQDLNAAEAVLVVDTQEGAESPAWVAVEDMPCLSPATLAQQSIEATFYKHHSSPLRGMLVPKWSLRYYELKAGMLQYRRVAGGKLCSSVSLEGARVVAEPAKASRIGDCYVFRILQGSEVLARLSCTNRKAAADFLLATAATCAYLRAAATVGTPPVEKCDKSSAAASTTPEDHITAAPSAEAGAPKVEQKAKLAVATPVRGPPSQSGLQALLARCCRMEPRALLTILLPLIVTLLTARRLRHRAIAR